MGVSAREKLLVMSMLGGMMQEDVTLSAECQRLGDAFRLASEAAETPAEDRPKLRELAITITDAGRALGAVTEKCNEVLTRVGSSDAPVAKALRDVARDINRRALGRYAYLGLKEERKGSPT